MYKIPQNSTLKAVTVALSLLVIACISFSYYTYSESVKTKKRLEAERDLIVKDLRKSKDSLELAIMENSSLKSELVIERQKVTSLLEEISSNTVDVTSILKYRSEVDRLKGVVANLTKEKHQLKQNNELLKTQRDSTILVLNDAKKYNEKLATMNENLYSTVVKGRKISVINLKALGMKEKSNGKLEVTDKANKVDVLQITFQIIGSKISKEQEKKYYVQIIDCKNNVIGERKRKVFGKNELVYSFESNVKFNNETMEVTAELALDNFEKGNYFVNVFDKNELASKSTFALH